MITFVIHFEVLPENAAQFVAAFAEMRKKVLENEPGAIHYALSKGQNPNSYMSIEIYRDETALLAHAQTEYLKESMVITAPLVVEGTVDYKRYDGVVPSTD